MWRASFVLPVIIHVIVAAIFFSFNCTIWMIKARDNVEPFLYLFFIRSIYGNVDSSIKMKQKKHYHREFVERWNGAVHCMCFYCVVCKTMTPSVEGKKVHISCDCWNCVSIFKINCIVSCIRFAALFRLIMNRVREKKHFSSSLAFRMDLILWIGSYLKHGSYLKRKHGWKKNGNPSHTRTSKRHHLMALIRYLCVIERTQIQFNQQ